MKLLVVEDSARDQIPLAPQLRARGYRVDVANDGVQAIAYASDQIYDVVILDLTLPKESSLLVLHEIRESDRQVEILILSTRDQIHDRVTALIQGANDYLVKPFTIDELHQRIVDLARRKLDAQPPRDSAAADFDSREHVNGLIENLLRHCSCDHGEIELVISEIKLAELLRRVCNAMQARLERKQLRLNLPDCKMPTLLVDARWTEHLFTNLLTNAISRCPANSEIDIGLLRDPDYCSITIENQLAQPISGRRLRKMWRDYRSRQAESDSIMAQLSLAKNYADCMNLELHASLGRKNRFCVWVSNIKIV